MSDHPLRASICTQLRTLRKQADLSQQALGRLMGQHGSPMNKATLSSYETGLSAIRLEDAAALALALDVPLAQLVVDETDPLWDRLA